MKSVNASLFAFILAAVFISSCKKELNTPATIGAEIPGIRDNANVEKKCRLVYFDCQR